MTDNSLRRYLEANMFDGDARGSHITMDGPALLDEVCQNVIHWMVETSGMGDYLERYYTVAEEKV